MKVRQLERRPNFFEFRRILFLILELGYLIRVNSLLTLSFRHAVSSRSSSLSTKTRLLLTLVRSTDPLKVEPGVISNDDLMPMDVVVFSEMENSKKRKLGAVQEDGRIAALSAWTTDFAFEESIEFVVDEEDLPGFESNDTNVRIYSVVPESLLSYGSRQVGGGKGPGNPHGEESESLYYIDKSILNDVDIVVNPDLEILW